MIIIMVTIFRYITLFLIILKMHIDIINVEITLVFYVTDRTVYLNKRS